MVSSCENYHCEGKTTGVCDNARSIDHQLGYFTDKEEAITFLPGFELFLQKIKDDVQPVCHLPTQLNSGIQRGDDAIKKWQQEIDTKT
jgi:hypothetical protein